MFVDVKSNEFLLNIFPKIALWISSSEEVKQFQKEKFNEYGGKHYHEIKNILAMFYCQAKKNGQVKIEGYENNVLLKHEGYKFRIYINNQEVLVMKDIINL